MKVVAVGDNCMDVYPELNKCYPGGNCVNFAVYMAKMGVQSAYVGVVGSDQYGIDMKNALKDKTVDISRLHTENGQTAITYVTLKDNDRILGDYAEGVFENFKLSNQDLSFIKEHDLIHMGIWGKSETYLPELKKSNAVISFDFADKLDQPMVIEILPFINYAFFSYQQDNEYIREYMKQIKIGGPNVVVVTLGENGSLAYDGSAFYKHGIKNVNVVDTLGAGDSFITGFMYGVLHKYTIEKCLATGTANAARTITYFGAW